MCIVLDIFQSAFAASVNQSINQSMANLTIQSMLSDPGPVSSYSVLFR